MGLYRKSLEGGGGGGGGGKISFVVGCKEFRGEVKEIDRKIKYTRRERKNLKRESTNIFGLQRTEGDVFFPDNNNNNKVVWGKQGWGLVQGRLLLTFPFISPLGHAV